MSSERGQASVELVAALPLVLAVVLAGAQLLAAGAAALAADSAAQAGAMALIQGRAPREAARASLPGWARSRASVGIEGRRVTVRLRPPAATAGLARALAASASAHAGQGG